MPLNIIFEEQKQQTYRNNTDPFSGNRECSNFKHCTISCYKLKAFEHDIQNYMAYDIKTYKTI